MTKTMLGTPVYMAPEILASKAYDTKADVWSIGTSIYQLIYGKLPFEGQSMQDLLI